MGSALLNTTTEQELAVDAGVGVSSLRRAAKDGPPQVRDAPALRTDSDSVDPLRMQVAERLAAHRQRRGGAELSAATTSLAEPVRSASIRSARIAATVAERYAHTPSYRAFLAAEAERAVEQARAAAEIAAMNARAIAEAQQKMLDAFDHAALTQAAMHAEKLASETQRARLHESRAMPEQVDKAPAPISPEFRAAEQNFWPDLDREEVRLPRLDSTQHMARPDSRATDTAPHVAKTQRTPAIRAAGLTVQLYEDGPGATHGYCGITRRVPSPAHTNRQEYSNEAEAMALDEEIAFRRAPSFEEPVGPPLPLPANLIEFPRQLVASRKARPRLAEGPLREEAEATAVDGQLRIFEVDSARISTQPVDAGSDTPQWTSIWLDTPAEPAKFAGNADADCDVDAEQWHDQSGEAIDRPVAHSLSAVQAASIARRVTAAGIDLSVAVIGGVMFAATAVAVFSRAEGAPAFAWNVSDPLLANLRLLATFTAGQTGLQPSQFGVIAAVAGVALILLYQGLFFWFSDATPGMRCARIALCTFKDENPTRRSVRRRLGAMLLSACALGFGFAWALLDEERLTWHDRITRMYLRSY